MVDLLTCRSSGCWLAFLPETSFVRNCLLEWTVFEKKTTPVTEVTHFVIKLCKVHPWVVRLGGARLNSNKTGLLRSIGGHAGSKFSSKIFKWLIS